MEFLLNDEIIACLAWKCVTCLIIVYVFILLQGLRLFWSFTLHILCLYSLPPGSPGAPGVRFYTSESPGANVMNGGGFPSLHGHKICAIQLSVGLFGIFQYMEYRRQNLGIGIG